MNDSRVLRLLQLLRPFPFPPMKPNHNMKELGFPRGNAKTCNSRNKRNTPSPSIMVRRNAGGGCRPARRMPHAGVLSVAGGRCMAVASGACRGVCRAAACLVCGGGSAARDRQDSRDRVLNMNPKKPNFTVAGRRAQGRRGREVRGGDVGVGVGAGAFGGGWRVGR